MGSVIDRMSGMADVDMSSPKAKFVVEVVNKNQVVIFSKTQCPYCFMAKEQFKKLNYPYVAIELDKRDDGDEIQNILLKMTGERTVPRVFLKGKCIGGGTETKKMHDNGTLRKMLDI